MQTLFLALSEGDNFGWGICGRYLRQEIPRLVPAVAVDPKAVSRGTILPGKVLHTLKGVLLRPLVDVRGEEEYGYTFFESELNEISLRIARRYRRVIGGSSWCADRLREKGVPDPAVLVQGIDPAVFFPGPPRPADGRFVIFSGGKLELRKGQDLVIRAVAALQQKHSDVHLVTAWYNCWPQIVQNLAASPHIRFEFPTGRSWGEALGTLLEANGVDGRRTVNLELVPQPAMREILLQTDVGVFPNRCEGGTNLVLMEYMACGRPAIAVQAHGQADVVNAGSAIPLTDFAPFELHEEGRLVARWVEPSLDELVAKLEAAYQNREALPALGARAGEFMRNFTWEACAREAVRILYG